MIDVAKIADLCLLMINAKHGFQMETFEFLNLLQTHGMPRVLGVLTHLDTFKMHTEIKGSEEEVEATDFGLKYSKVQNCSTFRAS